MLIGHCLKHATAEAQWPKIDVVRSCDGHASLKRLGTDHIDLLYIHKADFAAPLSEMVYDFADLIRTGKITYFGVSNF